MFGLRLLIESSFQNSQRDNDERVGYRNTVDATLKFLKTATPTELKEVLVDTDGASSDEEELPRTLETTVF